MNTAEIRSEFYEAKSRPNYDRSKENDELSFHFLTTKEARSPLGQRFRLLPQPLYARDGDWNYTSFYTYLFRVFAGLGLIKLGHMFGTWDSKDELLAINNVVWFEQEEQIFDELFNKNKTAVFLQLYTPGHLINEKFNRSFE
jgi:hypothetical protein